MTYRMSELLREADVGLQKQEHGPVHPAAPQSARQRTGKGPGRRAAALTSSPRGQGRGGSRGMWLWSKGAFDSAEVSGEAPALAPSKHNKGLREKNAPAAAQNPSCRHWRPSVRGPLMGHLIPRVDSPAPGPGLASGLALHLSLSLSVGVWLSTPACSPATGAVWLGVGRGNGELLMQAHQLLETLAENSKLDDIFHFSIQVETNRNPYPPLPVSTGWCERGPPAAPQQETADEGRAEPTTVAALGCSPPPEGRLMVRVLRSMHLGGRPVSFARLCCSTQTWPSWCWETGARESGPACFGSLVHLHRERGAEEAGRAATRRQGGDVCLIPPTLPNLSPCHPHEHVPPVATRTGSAHWRATWH
uniref:uncharacterized protein LOC106993193 n=1 Tax=Macaca mulatta TaxID=9544 RepID=UPI0003ABBDD7|nr:uncharacterized protein LOC106993193 [Macaca mulatta]XP_028689059.1 uncharacterized protein LOC106993193 [Macaca mulatta]